MAVNYLENKIWKLFLDDLPPSFRYCSHKLVKIQIYKINFVSIIFQISNEDL